MNYGLFLLLIAAVFSIRSGFSDETEFAVHEVAGLTYRVFEPKAERREYKLLVFLPGGRGDENFTNWCQSIYRQSIPDEFLAVQMIAPKWNTPAVVWPSKFAPTAGMKKPIDELFTLMVADLRKNYQIQKGELHTFSWSSGGTAAYLIAATQAEVKGHFIAMSVFRENWLPKRLNKFENQQFFIYHSQTDSVCKIEFARIAAERLKKENAEVNFVTYAGGHGWAPGNDHFGAIRSAFAWFVGK